MKAWQNGYELDTLIDWTNKFETYNKYCLFKQKSRYL